jgi:hypothetical protein
MATKTVRQLVYFFPSLFVVGGSWIWDPGWNKIRIQDKHPGSATGLRGPNV